MTSCTNRAVLVNNRCSMIFLSQPHAPLKNNKTGWVSRPKSILWLKQYALGNATFQCLLVCLRIFCISCIKLLKNANQQNWIELFYDPWWFDTWTFFLCCWWGNKVQMGVTLDPTLTSKRHITYKGQRLKFNIVNFQSSSTTVMFLKYIYCETLRISKGLYASVKQLELYITLHMLLFRCSVNISSVNQSDTQLLQEQCSVPKQWQHSVWSNQTVQPNKFCTVN